MLGDLALRLAGGVYRQYVMQSEISSAGPTSVVPSIQFWLPIDASIAPARAYHTTGSLLLTPGSVWSTRLESYYKWQPRTLHVDYASLVQPPRPTNPGQQRIRQQSDFVAAGQGRAYGLALHLHRDGERISGEASVEWSQVDRRYPNRFEGRYVPAPWEQPLGLTTTMDVKIVDEVVAQAQWQGIWGRSWAFRRGYYDYLAIAGGETVQGDSFSRPGRQTLSPFSRFDLGIQGETEAGGLTLEIQATLVNVFDRRNAFDQSLVGSGAAPSAVPRTLPGRRVFVLLGVRY